MCTCGPTHPHDPWLPGLPHSVPGGNSQKHKKVGRDDFYEPSTRQVQWTHSLSMRKDTIPPLGLGPPSPGPFSVPLIVPSRHRTDVRHRRLRGPGIVPSLSPPRPRYDLDLDPTLERKGSPPPRPSARPSLVSPDYSVVLLH